MGKGGVLQTFRRTSQDLLAQGHLQGIVLERPNCRGDVAAARPIVGLTSQLFFFDSRRLGLTCRLTSPWLPLLMRKATPHRFGAFSEIDPSREMTSASDEENPHACITCNGAHMCTRTVIEKGEKERQRARPASHIYTALRTALQSCEPALAIVETPGLAKEVIRTGSVSMPWRCAKPLCSLGKIHT